MRNIVPHRSLNWSHAANAAPAEHHASRGSHPAGASRAGAAWVNNVAPRRRHAGNNPSPAAARLACRGSRGRESTPFRCSDGAQPHAPTVIWVGPPGIGRRSKRLASGVQILPDPLRAAVGAQASTRWDSVRLVAFRPTADSHVKRLALTWLSDRASGVGHAVRFRPVHSVRRRSARNRCVGWSSPFGGRKTSITRPRDEKGSAVKHGVVCSRIRVRCSTVGDAVVKRTPARNCWLMGGDPPPLFYTRLSYVSTQWTTNWRA